MTGNQYHMIIFLLKETFLSVLQLKLLNDWMLNKDNNNKFPTKRLEGKSTRTLLF